MSNTPNDPRNPIQSEPVSRLLVGILDDLRSLLRLELQLAQARVQEKAIELGGAATYLGAALILLIPTSLLLALTLAFGLEDLTGWPTWLCHLAIGVFLAAVASFLAWCGIKAARQSMLTENSVALAVGELVTESEAGKVAWEEKSIN